MPVQVTILSDKLIVNHNRHDFIKRRQQTKMQMHWLFNTTYIYYKVWHFVKRKAHVWLNEGRNIYKNGNLRSHWLHNSTACENTLVPWIPLVMIIVSLLALVTHRHRDRITAESKMNKDKERERHKRVQSPPLPPWLMHYLIYDAIDYI